MTTQEKCKHGFYRGSAGAYCSCFSASGSSGSVGGSGKVNSHQPPKADGSVENALDRAEWAIDKLENQPEGKEEWEKKIAEVTITAFGMTEHYYKFSDYLDKQITQLLQKEREELREKISWLIFANNKCLNSKNECLLCLEQDYCEHKIKNEALQDILLLLQ